MTTYLAYGGTDTVISEQELIAEVKKVYTSLGNKERVIAVPPDFTRLNSKAGPITCATYEHYGNQLTDILPALGTHVPMPDWQLDGMFPGIPHDLFRPHDWRHDVVTIGTLPSAFVSEVSAGVYDKPWPCQLNKLIWNGGHDLIISIGQVVPHEVVGMANYTKNLFVGTGGAEGINESHFIGAAYGMERMMGRTDTPTRRLLNEGLHRFCQHLPIIFIRTVIGKDETTGELVTRGLYIGDDDDCFNQAAALSLQVNFDLLDEQPNKVVCYLDPEEFHTTWLGNKAIYRTRMAIADDGELIVLAPGVKGFGEDEAIDKLIRKYGYRTTPEIMTFLEQHEDLAGNLSAAAHLIHGSSEGRFTVTYCAAGLTAEEIEGVGYAAGDLAAMQKKYDPEQLVDGWNEVDGERVFFISNPALGLWAYKGRFDQ